MASNKDTEASEAAASSSMDIDAVVTPCMRSVAKCTAAVNALPGEKKQDWDFYSTFFGYRTVMDVERKKIEEMADKVLAWSGIKVKTAGMSVPDMMELLSEANDQILERVSIHLDEASGIRREAASLVSVSLPQTKRFSGSWNKVKAEDKAEESPVKLLTAKNVSRSGSPSGTPAEAVRRRSQAGPGPRIAGRHDTVQPPSACP